MDDCLFCKIINKEIPSTKVFENEYVYAFLDIEPQAPFHAVFVPKVHISSANDITDDNAFYIGEIFKAIKKVAAENDLQSGYRVVNNCGKDAGQTVFHIHFHLMGKRKFGWPAG